MAVGGKIENEDEAKKLEVGRVKGVIRRKLHYKIQSEELGSKLLKFLPRS